MLLPGESSPKTWLFITILVSTIIAFSETLESKTINIKLGFDLTQGSNGAPSLRIRDFEGSSGFNPRAMEDDSSSDSDSSSSKKKPKEHDQGSKDLANAKSSDSSDDDNKSSGSEEDNLRSTRGLKADDFEPEEENPKIHGKYQKQSESGNGSDESRRRRRKKRHIGKSGYRNEQIA